MSSCSAVFGVVDASGVHANEPRLLPLSRAAAQELVLLSILCPPASADLAAPLDPVLYATDAAEDKGGCGALLRRRVAIAASGHERKLCSPGFMTKRISSSGQLLAMALATHSGLWPSSSISLRLAIPQARSLLSFVVLGGAQAPSLTFLRALPSI